MAVSTKGQCSGGLYVVVEFVCFVFMFSFVLSLLSHCFCVLRKVGGKIPACFLVRVFVVLISFE